MYLLLIPTLHHAPRRAYQRAVLVPSHALDALYRDYESFENSCDKALARKVQGTIQLDLVES